MRFIGVLFLVVFLFSCREKTGESYKLLGPGYYYQLLAFEKKGPLLEKGSVVELAAIFETQQDSVFWDSYNNQAHGYYFEIGADTTLFMNHLLLKSSFGDSVCILVPTHDFFTQMFGSEVPYFSQGDSVVKIHLNIFPPADARNEMRDSEKEFSTIEKLFPNALAFETSRDSSGFFWLEKPKAQNGEMLRINEKIRISCQGFFVSGRALDTKPWHLEFNYGTPDQVLSGLNIVIGRLKKGQNAKIILPSRLAFGASGSSNGVVPPFTPLVYELSVEEAE